MKKLLKSIKYILSFLFCIILFSCGGETEEEYYERLQREKEEQAIANCPEFPDDFKDFIFGYLNYFRKDWGPDNETLIIKLKVNSPYYIDSLLNFKIDKNLNYEINLKSDIVSIIDSSTTLNYSDQGEFVLQEYNYTGDGYYADRDYDYHFNSSVDNTTSVKRTRKGASCGLIFLNYTRAINERDSIDVSFFTSI